MKKVILPRSKDTRIRLKNNKQKTHRENYQTRKETLNYIHHKTKVRDKTPIRVTEIKKKTESQPLSRQQPRPSWGEWVGVNMFYLPNPHTIFCCCPNL